MSLSLISWKTSTQKLVPQSTAESEMLVLVEACKEVGWATDLIAEVCKVYVKRKKLTVMYIDTPNLSRHIRLSFHRIKHYHSFKSSQLLSEIPSLEVSKWKDAVSLVEEYLCKRALQGSEVSPIKYFQYPYLYICRDMNNLQNDDEDTTNNTSLHSTLTKNASEKDYSVNQWTEANHEIQDGTILENCRKFTDNVLKCIKSEDCKTYLLQVLNAKINNDRHHRFFSSTSSVRRQLKLESGFGPLKDTMKIDEICMYLISLCKSADIPQYFDVTAYVFEVWIPEAIKWAMTKIMEISSQQAEAYFLKGSIAGLLNSTEQLPFLNRL